MFKIVHFKWGKYYMIHVILLSYLIIIYIMYDEETEEK